MPIDPLPEHIRRPHLRPIQPMPMDREGKPFVALRDPAMMCKQTMVVPAHVMNVLHFFRGDRPIDQIAEQLKGDVNQFIELAKGLDRVGLLWGPTFEQMEAALLEKIKADGVFPPNASLVLGQDADACRKAIDEYFDQTEDPELAGAPIGIVAPHLDYERGWPNYAAAYFSLRETAPPDRVVILGTNHFGLGDGVVLSEFGFESQLGRCPVDRDVVSGLMDRVGQKVIVDQLDHVPEHSIQLHIPWLQYCFGNVPVAAALIPDPLTPMLDDDGKRAMGDEFLTAFKGILEDLGGKTLFIASSDLSHVGPQFGEPRRVDDQRRFDVERHDREMVAKFLAGDAEEFLGAFRWNRNPTRWCSIGNMTAILALARPESLELIDYRQAYDEQGMVMVTSAAIALF